MRSTALTASAAPAAPRKVSASQRLDAKPKRDDRNAPGSRCDEDRRSPACGRARHPAGQERDDERPAYGAAIQKADDRPARRRSGRSKGREERARHPEDHRDRVDRGRCPRIDALARRGSGSPRDRAAGPTGASPRSAGSTGAARRKERCEKVATSTAYAPVTVRSTRSGSRRAPGRRRGRRTSRSSWRGRCRSELVRATRRGIERAIAPALDRGERGAERTRARSSARPGDRQRGIATSRPATRGRPELVEIRRRRRSSASAAAPPRNDSVSSGMSSASRGAPTASVEPVRW